MFMKFSIGFDMGLVLAKELLFKSFNSCTFHAGHDLPALRNGMKEHIVRSCRISIKWEEAFTRSVILHW